MDCEIKFHDNLLETLNRSATSSQSDWVEQLRWNYQCTDISSFWQLLYYLNSTKLRVAGGGGSPMGSVLGFSTRVTCLVEATMQGHAPNVPAINMVLIWVRGDKDGAMAIVSGEVTIAVVNALWDQNLWNVLGSHWGHTGVTLAMSFVENTGQRRVPNVYAINMVFILVRG